MKPIVHLMKFGGPEGTLEPRCLSGCRAHWTGYEYRAEQPGNEYTAFPEEATCPECIESITAQEKEWEAFFRKHRRR